MMAEAPESRGRLVERYALTPIQEGLVAETLMGAGRGTNVEQVVWELDTPPDATRFRMAWKSALQAFDALRLDFEWASPNQPTRQLVRQQLELPFHQLDISASEAEQQQQNLERFLWQDREAGLDLSIPPLMRVSLLRLSPTKAICVWTVHHSIIDGTSFALVLRHVLDHYAGPSADGEVRRAEPARFTDFLRWHERQDMAAAVGHFADVLRGFSEPTALPLQPAASQWTPSSTLEAHATLDADATRRLQEVAAATATTPNAILQLAWAVLLSRYSGAADIVFGAIWSGRPGTIERAQDTVGPFISTLPIRVTLSAFGTVRELLAALRQSHLALRPFQHVGLSKIRAASEASRFPQLFQTLVAFDYERLQGRLEKIDPRWGRQRVWSQSQTGYPLVLAATLAGGQLELELEYASDLYSEEGVAGLLADYARILHGILEGLDRSPFELPMLAAELERQLTTDEAQRELVAAQPVAIERVLRQARLTPNQVAIREVGGNEITYATLEQRALRLARALRKGGVGDGALVGLYLPRSIQAIVAMLAVHAAGGAFVALDPRDPATRVAFILADSRPVRVIVNAETRGRLESAGELELDIDRAIEESASELPAWNPPAPAYLAYVIYTSGSTGEPKGVCVSQGSLANHLTATLERFELRPEDRVLQFAALTFDVALEEVMPTLAAGATLILRNEEMVGSSRAFFDVVVEQKISVLNLPSPFWHQLVHAAPRWPRCVRLLVVGSERVSPEAHRKFREADTAHVRWLNAYGPTEATITSTCYDDAEADHDDQAIPIGRPLAGVSHFVLDGYLRPLPPGAIGQLYIGGVGLASGYLKRQELTAKCFVPHPFRQGASLYVTGDRVRRTPRGNYVYVDRQDNQVKVRGFRVELGEVEARLRQHPLVQAAAVVLSESGEGMLVGFVAADGERVAEEELRQHLAACLPSHMVPSRLVISSTLPTTSSGKVDRKALARRDVSQRPAREVLPLPDDGLLTQVLEIWSEVLGAPVTDPWATLFDLGGHSLQVVQIFTQIEEQLGRTCNVRDFFQNPTAGHLADILRGSTASPAALTQLAAGEAHVLPLFFAPGLTGRQMDFVNLARALPNSVPVYALKLGTFRPEQFPQQTLKDVARALVDAMQAVQSQGPYAVAGYSAGGVLAVVMAEELRARGQILDFVGLIDCVPPSSVPVLSPLTSPRRLFRLSRTVVGRVREIMDEPAWLPQLWRRTSSAALRGVARWKLLPLQYRAVVQQFFGEAPSQFSAQEMAAMQRYLDAIEEHRFENVGSDFVLFRTPLDPPEGPHEQDLGWGRVTTGRIVVEQLEGGHAELITERGCDALAARMQTYLTQRVVSNTGATRAA